MKDENINREIIREILDPPGPFDSRVFDAVCAYLGLPENHQMVPHLYFNYSPNVKRQRNRMNKEELDDYIDKLLTLAADYFLDKEKPPIQIVKEAVANQAPWMIVLPKLSMLPHVYPIYLYNELLLKKEEAPEDILAEFIYVREYNLYEDLGKLGVAIEYENMFDEPNYDEEKQLLFLKSYPLKYLDRYVEYVVECRKNARAYIEQDLKQKYLGCLLGGAVGDALGAPIEFMSLDEIERRYGKTLVNDYVEYPGNIGEITDDTQMTLFTIEGLLRAKIRAEIKGVCSVSAVTHHAYLRWLKTQSLESNYSVSKHNLECGWLFQQKELFTQRAPGNSCLSALFSDQLGTTYQPINNSKGCGGIMRMAPVGLAFPAKGTSYLYGEHAFDLGCELAALTHGHPTGYLAAGSFAALIAFLVYGVELEEAISKVCTILKKKEGHKEVLEAIEGAVNLSQTISYDPEMIEELLGGGWIAEEALAISLYCALCFEDDFTAGVLAAINHSGDSDSTGAITGNILGVIHGMKGVPEKWVTNLKYVHILQEISSDFYECVNGPMDYPDDRWWNKYPGY